MHLNRIPYACSIEPRFADGSGCSGSVETRRATRCLVPIELMHLLEAHGKLLACLTGCPSIWALRPKTPLLLRVVVAEREGPRCCCFREQEVVLKSY